MCQVCARHGVRDSVFARSEEAGPSLRLFEQPEDVGRLAVNPCGGWWYNLEKRSGKGQKPETD
jgi:hypothetical protein